MFPFLLRKARFAIKKAHVVESIFKNKKSHRLSGSAGGSLKGSSLTCNSTRDVGAGLDSLAIRLHFFGEAVITLSGLSGGESFWNEAA